jgi:hypothetical protein
MFSVLAGTDEEKELLTIDSMLEGSGLRVEGLLNGILFCRIEDTRQSLGSLQKKLIRVLEESMCHEVSRVYLQS